LQAKVCGANLASLPESVGPLSLLRPDGQDRQGTFSDDAVLIWNGKDEKSDAASFRSSKSERSFDHYRDALT
jgi:hypothetical protein